MTGDTSWTDVEGSLCQFRVKNGVCTMQGQSWGGTTLKKGEITHIATMPYPYRPTARHKFAGSGTGSNDSIYGYIESDGKVYLCSPGVDLPYFMYGTTFII